VASLNLNLLFHEPELIREKPAHAVIIEANHPLSSPNLLLLRLRRIRFQLCLCLGLDRGQVNRSRRLNR